MSHSLAQYTRSRVKNELVIMIKVTHPSFIPTLMVFFSLLFKIDIYKYIMPNSWRASRVPHIECFVVT